MRTKGTHTAQTSFRLSANLHDRITGIARREAVSKGVVLRRALELGVAALEKQTSIGDVAGDAPLDVIERRLFALETRMDQLEKIVASYRSVR